jgi:hypothetical protein
MEMTKPTRVIAVFDLPPRRAPQNVRESYEAAAQRWDAELHWIRGDLQPCHPFWQKMFVCRHVQKLFGPSHVLQLDNDMLIRSDCPSPFEMFSPKQFGIVAERQSAKNRIDNGGWQQRAHDVWASRCKIQPAPTWLHPNGGLYLYGTEMYGPMFARIIRHLLPTWGASDQATDESLIINQLYQDHPGYIKFLAPDFNVSMVYLPAWASNPVMQSYIYHFVGRTKEHIDNCVWQRSDPPELPFPGHSQTLELVQQWGDDPPATFDIGPIFTPQLAANLLAIYPELVITGHWSNEPHHVDSRMIIHNETGSSHLVLTRFLLQLGVNARRFQLRVTEDADATPQLAGT